MRPIQQVEPAATTLDRREGTEGQPSVGWDAEMQEKCPGTCLGPGLMGRTCLWAERVGRLLSPAPSPPPSSAMAIGLSL